MQAGMQHASRAMAFAAGAFELFARRGLDQVTMDDIAAKGRATKGSLYWHYRSKDEVVEAACRHYYQKWHEDTQRNIARVSDPVEKIRITVRNSVRSCLIDEKNRVFTMEILTRALHDQATRDGWRLFFVSVRAFYLALVEAAVEAGSLKCADSAQAVDVMLSAMEGYKLRAVFEPSLCSRSEERAITRELLGLLNIAMPRNSRRGGACDPRGRRPKSGNRTDQP
jgi:AcrR family transcriptional regulator